MIENEALLNDNVIKNFAGQTNDLKKQVQQFSRKTETFGLQICSDW